MPVDMPVYTAEVTHRDPVSGELLQKALDRTLKRMPYLADTLVEENGKIYYAKNPLPMEVAHFKGPRRVGGEETNYHQLDVSWDENTTWFSMYHGFTDGQGLYMLHKLMEIKKNKELYDAPSTIVFEVKTEGVICTSGLNDPNDYQDGGNPFQF